MHYGKEVGVGVGVWGAYIIIAKLIVFGLIRNKLNSFNKLHLRALVQFCELFQFISALNRKPFNFSI